MFGRLRRILFKDNFDFTAQAAEEVADIFGFGFDL